MIFPRTGKLKPTIEQGFKNARGGQDSIKEQSLWRESFEALKGVFKIEGHEGTRRVYNATGGDLAIAQQLLGNSDLKSRLVYTKRDKAALRKHVQKDWKENQLLEAIR